MNKLRPPLLFGEGDHIYVPNNRKQSTGSEDTLEIVEYPKCRVRTEKFASEDGPIHPPWYEWEPNLSDLSTRQPPWTVSGTQIIGPTEDGGIAPEDNLSSMYYYKPDMCKHFPVAAEFDYIQGKFVGVALMSVSGSIESPFFSPFCIKHYPYVEETPEEPEKWELTLGEFLPITTVFEKPTHFEVVFNEDDLVRVVVDGEELYKDYGSMGAVEGAIIGVPETGPLALMVQAVEENAILDNLEVRRGFNDDQVQI